MEIFDDPAGVGQRLGLVPEQEVDVARGGDAASPIKNRLLLRLCDRKQFERGGRSVGQRQSAHK